MPEILESAPLQQQNGVSKLAAGRTVFFGAADPSLSFSTQIVRKRNRPPASKVMDYSYFPMNQVSSAKYNFWNFIPLQLLYQFSKFANLYFLFISILQQVPGWSPTGKFTTAGPLAVFVCLAMAREAYDDWKRHQQDAAENNTTSEALRPEGDAKEAPSLFSRLLNRNRMPLKSEARKSGLNWRTVKWKDIRIGDILRVADDDNIPADLVLLASSREDGSCYVETKSLDGETTLKQKTALKETATWKERDFHKVKGCLQAEAPNNELYKFNGHLEFEESKHKSEKLALSIGQLLLRGSTLKNTKYVYGVVVFTGEETKIRKNANTDIKAKLPAVERRTNMIVIAIFSLVFVLAIFSTVFSTSWSVRNVDIHTYIDLGNSAALGAVGVMFTFVILYNTMIPISLYVTMEMIKLAQAYLISNDPGMMDPKTGKYAVANTSSLNENLGQVTHVFSDKTGTLTENIMKFRKFTAFGKPYRHIPINPTAPVKAVGKLKRENTVQGPELLSAIHAPGTADPKLQLFIEAMALCQTAMLSAGNKESRTSLATTSSFQASSPDEVAILQAAGELGYRMTKRTTTGVTLAVRDPLASPEAVADSRTYEILNVIEFTSERKRMSVLYRYPNNEIVLLTKGADSEIFKRLKPGAENLGVTKEQVSGYATDGLRTLVYGYKKLSNEQFEEWAQKFREANTSIVDRQEAVNRVADEMERDLELIGATAIEDQLQGGVPETLENFQRAGIKVWVCTGDKRETAINIGYSSNLLKRDSVVHVLDWTSELSSEKFRAKMEHIAALDSKQHNVLVIDGDTLGRCENQHQDFLLKNPKRVDVEFQSLINYLMYIGNLCDSVICCRVSPIQKALIVRYMKSFLGNSKVTLAVGDGANDIAMICEAHVGIGIAGREGVQAARASDYYIYRFRFLNRLLFVHGRWSYVRVTKFVLGSFYKCITFYMTQLIFQSFTGVSGTSLYESWTLAMYNLAFSSLPVIFVGIFEKDISEEILVKAPEVYMLGQQNDCYNLRVMFGWLISAIYHAVVLTYVPLAFFELTGDISSDMQDTSLYLLGTIVYSSVVFVVNFKIANIESYHWAWPTQLILFLTFAVWFGYQLFYSLFWQWSGIGYDNYGVFPNTASLGNYYFIILLTTVICLVPELVFHFFKRYFYPSGIDLLRERYHDLEKMQNKTPLLSDEDDAL